MVNPNASASTVTAWTQWLIRQSDLTGVSLTTVQKLTVGVGDKTNPKAGAAGMLYFDDIGYGHPAGLPNIIWVSDDNTLTAGVPADMGWVTLLKAQGYNVDYQTTGTAGTGTWDTLDATKIATLNAADLIIVSRDMNSGNIASDATEVATWNGIKKPLLLLMPHMARSTDRWLWLNTTTQNDGQPALQAVKLDHPIFSGVTLDAKNQVNVVTMTTSISAATDAGNGTLIATRADNGQVWIAEWQPGKPFYSGSTQTPGGQRMLFCAGGPAPRRQTARTTSRPTGRKCS